MENSHEESPLSAVEDFSPPPSSAPADLSDSDRAEGLGVGPYMFELLSVADSAAEPTETQAHPARGPAPRAG